MDELYRGQPPEFTIYMNYISQMDDPDRPDYAYLRSLFGAKRLKFKHDNVFDWTIREYEKLSTYQPPFSATGDRELTKDGSRADKARHGCRRTRQIRAVSPA